MDRYLYTSVLIDITNNLYFLTFFRVRLAHVKFNLVCSTPSSESLLKIPGDLDSKCLQMHENIFDTKCLVFTG